VSWHCAHSRASSAPDRFLHAGNTTLFLYILCCQDYAKLGLQRLSTELQNCFWAAIYSLNFLLATCSFSISSLSFVFLTCSASCLQQGITQFKYFPAHCQHLPRLRYKLSHIQLFVTQLQANNNYKEANSSVFPTPAPPSYSTLNSLVVSISAPPKASQPPRPPGAPFPGPAPGQTLPPPPPPAASPTAGTGKH